MKKRKAEDGDTEEERQRWKGYVTGNARLNAYNSVKRDEGGYPLFVPATSLTLSHLKGEDQRRKALALPNDIDAANNISSYRKDDEQESMSSLYARLTSTTQPRPRISEANVATPYEDAAGRPPMPKKATPAQSTWFIRKAVSSKASATPPTARHESEGPAIECDICHTVHPSRTSLQAHQDSIAHQLAANGFQNDSADLSNKPSKSLANDDRVGRVKLKNTNVGFAALERMGWQVGMGLGRAEFELARRRAEQEAEQKSQRDDVYETSTDLDDNLVFGSDEWYALVVAHGRRSGMDAVVRQPSDDDSNATDNKFLAQPDTTVERPLLEPIAVQLRRDRRGVGPSIRSRPTIIATGDKDSAKDSVAAPVSNKDRRRTADREREERKAMRASLDF
jgi:hypothetical protein